MPLAEGNAGAIADATEDTMGAFLRVSCSLLRKDAWLQAEIGATFVGICGMFPEHIIAVVDKCAPPPPRPALAACCATPPRCSTDLRPGDAGTGS
eukprot:COSAG04_NODE_6682_length_1278_cov_217.912638_2_plen_95_part_00